MEPTPFSERSNAITENIDVSSPAEMIQMLRQTDAEIFTGINSQNLFSEEVIEAMRKVSQLVSKTISDYGVKDVAIVLGGCGTSGRLAYLTTSIFNDLAEKVIGGKPFCHSIAGGNMSILISQEAPEDDTSAAVSCLLKICEGKKKVIYIGVSCGISAPFVGAQLEYCMKHLDMFTPVLLGFNPPTMARNVAITGWDKTMRVVAKELDALAKRGEAYLVNPVLGPEAISGSSRMKGGSATKVILDAMYLLAINALATGKKEEIETHDVTGILKLYQEVCRKFYESSASDVLADVVTRCGDALKSGGTIRYVASGWSGVLPIIDSTECPPTYGATVNDVRGFVLGGYNFLGIEDFGKENEYYKLGLDDFTALYRQSGSTNDAVLTFIQSHKDPLLKLLPDSELGKALRNLKAQGKSVAVVFVKPSDPKENIPKIDSYFDRIFYVPMPTFDEAACANWNPTCRLALEDSLYGCCLKWTVNAASTGGHVLLGKVYRNYMCDVKVTNSKLYHRAIILIETMCRDISYEKAKEALLKSIHEVDELTDEIRNGAPSSHYRLTDSKEKVVPIAIILAKSNCSVEDAKKTLLKYRVVRSLILDVAGK